MGKMPIPTNQGRKPAGVAPAKQAIRIDLSALPSVTNKIYYPLYFNRHRYLVLYGGAGSGKSQFAAQKILVRAVMTPGERLLVVRKVARTLRHSCFQMIKSIMADWNWTQLPGLRVNKSDMAITFPNGSEILFAGLDDVEKLKSIHGVTSIWIEEATELKEEDFTQLDIRLRGNTPTYKQIMLSFNPISIIHWLRERFFVNPDREKCYICHSNYTHNAWIDSEYKAVLESLAQTNPNLHKIYAKGEWGQLKGLIYDMPPELMVWPQEEWFDERVFGLDFGFNNPCALAEVGFKEKKAYEREHIYQSGLTTSDLIRKMVSIRSIIGSCPIYADSAEPDRIEEIRRHGFNVWACTKTAKVHTQIMFVKSIPTHLTVDSQNAINEYASYSWAVDKEDKTLDEPVKFADHYMDAHRYAKYSHMFRYSNKDTGKQPLKKLKVGVW